MRKATKNEWTEENLMFSNEKSFVYRLLIGDNSTRVLKHRVSFISSFV